MAKIIDNFILIEPLGSGLHSETLKGRNLVSKSPVAVKTIKLDQFLNNQTLREMVINEIQLLKKLDHPNILQMLKMLKSSNNIYLIYEYMSGGKLSSFLTKTGPVGEGKALFLFRQMAEAIMAIQKEELSHNNVSCDTIFICEEQIKVKNLMMAKPVGGKKCVEPENLYYASPEILAGGAPGFKSDVFSLGLVFWEVLKGSHLLSPLFPLSKESLLSHYKSPSLFSNSDLFDSISPELSSILRRMLSFEESERLPLEKLVLELQSLMKEEPKVPFLAVSNKKIDKILMKERNKVQFLVQNVAKILAGENGGLTVEFPRNLLVLSLLKAGVKALENILSFCQTDTQLENFIFNSLPVERNELKAWLSTDFGVYYINTIQTEQFQLKQTIEKLIKEETILLEKDHLGQFGLEWFKEEAVSPNINDENLFLRWLYSFGHKVYESLSRQKENNSEGAEEKEQGVLANYVLDVVFFKEFFENFIKSDGKLHEQKYFRHVESVGVDKLVSMLEKKLAYARKQLQIT